MVQRVPAISAEVTYRLAQRSALSNGNLITFLHAECRRNMSSQIPMSLFIPGVFGDKMKVFAPDNDCSMHLRRDDGASQNSTTDRDLTSKWAFLICDGGQKNGSEERRPIHASCRNIWWLPIYVPSIAVFGVLKPRPTSLYHLRPPFPTLVLLVLLVFWLTKICGCF